MPHKIIDTHIHVWNFDHAEYAWLKGDTSILNRTYHIHEIEDERKEVGITGGVLVQAACNMEDTDWMLKVADATPWISGVVGWLPLMDPQATEKALKGKYIANNYYKGIRHLIHDEADPKWLLQEKVIESLKIVASANISYDVVGVLPEHIETVLKVAEKVPDLRMVFDHLNAPPIANNEKFGRWGELMAEAAKNKQFHAKISGLGTATKKQDWTGDDIKPYIEFVLEHFGEDRCLCGGDWPVSLLAGSYSKTWNNYIAVIESLLDDEGRDKVFNKNASAFYHL